MALQNGSTVQFRPLNAFIAYRSFYNRMLPNMHQKERSGVLTTLWNADPYKNEWTLVAKVFSFLRAELGKDAVSLPSFLEHACSVLRIPTLDAYLEQQGFSLLEKENGKLTLVKDQDGDAMATTMDSTPAHTTRSKRQTGQVAGNSGAANAVSHQPSVAFQVFKERNKENISVAAGVFAEMKAAGAQANAHGDEEAAAGLYAEHELLQAVFDRGLVLNESALSSETSAIATTSSTHTPEISDTNHNSHDLKKHLIQKLYSKAYEILIGGEYPIVIGAKDGFSHTIKHNPIAAAAQIFAREKPFDFDVLVVDDTDEVKNHVFCKVQPSVDSINGHKNDDSDQGSSKSNNTDIAIVLEPTGGCTTAVHKMAGPFSMDPENQKQWQKRQSRSMKKDLPTHDSENSTALFTQKMAYQSAQNDAKFFIFSCQPSKSSNRIPSLTESAADSDGTSSHASSPADSPLPAVASTRFINRSIDSPLPSLPAVFTLPDSSHSPESIQSIDSISSIDSIDSIDIEHDQNFAVPTTPMTCDIMQGQVHANPPNQDDSESYMWGGGSASSGIALHDTNNYSYGLGYGLDENGGNSSGIGPGLSAGVGPGSGYSHSTGYGHNTSYGCNYGSDTTDIFDNNYFAAPEASFAPNGSGLPYNNNNTSLTAAESVLGKRRHDGSDLDEGDRASAAPAATPLKRNRLQQDMDYLTYSLRQDPGELIAQLSSRQRPAIFHEIYRSQRLQAAMASACGDTTAGRHTTAATTAPLSPSPGPDPIANVAAYFSRQTSSAGSALDLSQPQALDPMLGMGNMGGLGGMIGLPALGGNLGDLSLGLGMGATQDGGLFPTTTAPEVPAVYMNWPTSNMN